MGSRKHKEMLRWALNEFLATFDVDLHVQAYLNANGWVGADMENSETPYRRTEIHIKANGKPEVWRTAHLGGMKRFDFGWTEFETIEEASAFAIKHLARTDTNWEAANAE